MPISPNIKDRNYSCYGIVFSSDLEKVYLVKTKDNKSSLNAPGGYLNFITEDPVVAMSFWFKEACSIKIDYGNWTEIETLQKTNSKTCKNYFYLFCL